MLKIDIEIVRQVPSAQSENVYTIKNRTREKMEQTIRENWKYVDEMMDSMEPGHNY
jgi:hypothetical protein